LGSFLVKFLSFLSQTATFNVRPISTTRKKNLINLALK
jgi:hypothetical protein